METLAVVVAVAAVASVVAMKTTEATAMAGAQTTIKNQLKATTATATETASSNDNNDNNDGRNGDGGGGGRQWQWKSRAAALASGGGAAMREDHQLIGWERDKSSSMISSLVNACLWIRSSTLPCWKGMISCFHMISDVACGHGLRGISFGYKFN
jgi:hypothetical protein